MLVNILIPVLAMTALGLIFGAGIAYALKIFRIEIDPITFKILSILPGANCGACGKAGCAGFAEALKKGEAVPAGCVVSQEEARKSISELLGRKHEAVVKTGAFILCNGGSRAYDKFVYRGIKTCKAASLIFGGHKACSFGCLGFGDCAVSCPFGAIKMGEDGLPEVDLAKCTACGVCVKTCPKKLYFLKPLTCKYYVKCSSKDPGSVVAKVCKAGCIACLKCEKACPLGAVKVKDNLSRIEPGKCKDLGKCFEVCPVKVIATHLVHS